MADDGRFATLTDDDVENIVNQKLSSKWSNTKKVVEMSVSVLHEYARAKSTPLNELKNLPQKFIMKNANHVISPVCVHF